MESKRAVCWVFFRALLPLVQLGATIVRFNGFSLMYGCLLLVAPLLPAPSVISMKGRTLIYLIVELTLCSMTLLAQIIFQSYLLIVATDDKPYGEILQNCTPVESGLRQFGLQRLEPNDFVHIVRVILPDILMFLMALIVFLLCYKLLKPPPAQTPQEGDPQEGEDRQLLSTESPPPSSPAAVKSRRPSRSNAVISFMGEFLVALFLCASGIAYPCILSSLYFLTFLFLATWWACYRRLGRIYTVLRVILLVVSGLHLILLYLYQFQFFQEAVSHTSLSARLVGLTGIVRTDCDHKPWMLVFWNDIEWPMYVSPAMILILYFVLATEIRRRPLMTEDAVDNVQIQDASKRKSRGKRASETSAAGTERQVLDGADKNEALMGDEHRSYHSMDNADTDSIVPQPDIYGSANEGAAADQPDGKPDVERSKLVSVLVFLMKQSYIYTLIVMMVWSIMYHSWLAFVFLLSACIIWIFPCNRYICLRASPLIVCYAEGLLTIQYVYGLNIKLTDYEQIGLSSQGYACVHLAVKVAFTAVFWVTLRQFMRELIGQRDEDAMQGLALVRVHDDDDAAAQVQTSRKDFVDGYDSATVKAMGHWVWHMMCKYWIFVCAAMFLVIAILEAVIYRIVYMVLFLYFVTALQLCYRWWRLSMCVFWWIVVIYSMLVLCIIYTYQFDQFQNYWNMTGLSEPALQDLGLETYDTATLFVKLLTPTSFLIVIILQLHYFHLPFLRISDINRFKYAPGEEQGAPAADTAETPAAEEGSPTTPASDGEGGDQAQGAAGQGEDVVEEGHDPGRDTDSGLKVSVKKGVRYLWNTGYKILDMFSALVWRILEVHMVKVAMLTIFICSLVEVSAVNVPLILMVIVAIPLPSIQRIMSHVCLVWAGVVILAKMIYQLNQVRDDLLLTNCENGTITQDYPWNETIDNMVYIGLQKTNNLAHYLRLYIAIILVLAFESIIYLHQRQYYNKPGKSQPLPGIIFPEIKRPDADKGLIQCAKFFANYMFYKFGLEICFIMTVVTMVIRLDIYSVLYGIFVAVLLVLNRRQCFMAWPAYMVILLVLLTAQYLSCLGVPGGLCWDYPWDQDDLMTGNLKIYLYLPNFVNPPDPYKLIADFFQVLFVCLQWRVFRIEISTQRREKYGGGSNKSIVDEIENNAPNPTEDFIVCKDSYLDYLKSVVFRYMFWVTLIIVFIAGTARISLFCMGYLVGCFYFFWYGQELLVKPIRKLIRLWRILIGYAFVVIICKACLQLVGCVYMSHLAKKFCWVVQLFSIMCLRAGNYLTDADDKGAEECNMDEDEAGLTYDAICFVFLLLQLRIYTCHYFRHVVMELEVQMLLSSRGAELINTSLIKQVEAQKDHETKVLDSIKRKMERIKMRQDRLHGKSPMDSDNHYVVIRSGDYYMFDDVDSDDDAESEDTLAQLEKERDGLPDDDDETVGPIELINTALKGGTKEALSVAEKGTRKSQVSESEGGPSEPTSPVAPKPTPESPLGEGDETDGKEKEKEKKEPLGRRIINALKLAWAVFCGAIDYVIRVLQTISREYRSVSKILDDEKEEEKRRIRAELAKGPDHQPTEDEDAEREGAAADADPEDADTKALTPKHKPDVPVPIEEGDRQRDFEENMEQMRESEEQFKSSMPRILQLVVALFDALMSHSELVCYFAMILNHLVTASLLSLFYPVSVFLWALLSVPRPAKTYWITVITYTEAIVVVKYLFQFGFFPWNDDTVHESPFWPPRIIGIEKKDMYAAFDLFLLFCLFIHRSVLKSHGLWKDAEDIDADMKKAENKVISPTTSPVGSPTQPTPAITFNDDAENLEASLQRAKDEEDDDDDDEEGGKKKGCLATVFGPFKKFYRQMTNPQYNAVTDVYAPMFLCDFIVFLITIFGYSSFGPSAGGEGAGAEVVASVIQENKVPLPFLIMLLIQFLLIVVDRALYLRKNIMGKFVFQIVLVIAVHVWLFFVLPAITHRRFTDNVPAQLWYFTKCVYFALSAYQIRSGYPTRILGNFLTKRYNHASLFLFKGFLAIPFLLELRAVMDWMWTDTTLALTSWLQMEDIYANIFCLKCYRTIEKKYPTPRGEPRKAPTKYGVGGLLLFILIFIIWFPLLLFSLASAVYESNPPVDCTVEIKIGGYEPIWQMSAQQQYLQQFTDKQYSKFKDSFSKDAAAVTFFENYKSEDVFAVRLDGVSLSTWGVSPPSESILQDVLREPSNNISFYFQISFTREPSSQITTKITNTFSKNLIDPKIREALANQINGTATADVVLDEVFPEYMLVPPSDKPIEVQVLLNAHQRSFTGIKTNMTSSSTDMWWQVAATSKIEAPVPPPPSGLPEEHGITIIIFNDRIAPGALSFLTSYGVIGLYVSLVLVIGQFVRLFVSGLSYKIMWEQLPYVDRVLHLCRNIYLVRESRYFRMEEELFAKLIFLYRSPETMIKMTKPKQE